MIRNFGVNGLVSQPQGLDLGLNSNNIKTLQTGSATFTEGLTSITVSISSVDLNKAVLLFNYMKDNSTIGTGTADCCLIMGTITNSETLTFSVGNVASSNFAISWTVIEFNNIKTLQRGIVTISDVSYDMQNFSVSSIDITKSFLVVSQKSTNSTDSLWIKLVYRYAIIDATTIGIGSIVSPSTFDYQLIEFN